jgi:hypothetical protein
MNMGRQARLKQMKKSLNGNHPLVSILDIAKEFYKQFGKGCVILIKNKIAYARINHSGLNQSDVAIIKQSDYQNMFPVCIFGDTGSSFSALGLFPKDDEILLEKKKLPPNWRDGLKELVLRNR